MNFRTFLSLFFILSLISVYSQDDQTKFYGEKFNFKNQKVNIAAKFHYDDYPANPNGSEQAAAAVCSNNGRHLAIMPHLERSIFPWNWAHYPSDRKDKISPWILTFYNARLWLEENA